MTLLRSLIAASTDVRVPGDLTRRGTITGVGDSITSNVGNYPLLSDEGYLAWLVHRLGSRLQYVERAGAGGYTTAQILAELVPLAIARQPTYAVVCAGTNDISQDVTLAMMMANYTAICARLRAAGIIPVCTTVPPVSTGSTARTTRLIQFNTWIARHARQMGYLFVNTHAALIDPSTGTYVSTYTDDGTHPNPAGAKIMGYAIADAIAPLLPVWSPPLVASNTDLSDGHMAPTFGTGFTDAGGDSLPDASSPRTGLFFQSGQSDASLSYINRNGSSDRWLTIQRTGNTATTEIRGGGTATSGAIVTAGAKLALGIRFKLTGMGAGNSVDIRCARNTSTNTLIASVLNGWNADIDETTFYGEFDVPAGWTGVRWAILIAGPSGPTLSVAQLTTRDLAAIGG